LSDLEIESASELAELARPSRSATDQAALLRLACTSPPLDARSVRKNPFENKWLCRGPRGGSPSGLLLIRCRPKSSRLETAAIDVRPSAYAMLPSQIRKPDRAE